MLSVRNSFAFSIEPTKISNEDIRPADIEHNGIRSTALVMRKCMKKYAMNCVIVHSARSYHKSPDLLTSHAVGNS